MRAMKSGQGTKRAVKKRHLLVFPLLFLAAAGAGCLFFGCRPSPDFDALRREILDLHLKTVDAHWKKDPGFFTAHMADGYFAVQNGKVRRPSRKDIAAEYERYLATTTFTEYRDLQEPLVGFSRDGSVAWSVVQVKVAGSERAETGPENKFDLVWAWITLYERKDGRWIWLGEASTFKPVD